LNCSTVLQQTDSFSSVNAGREHAWLPVNAKRLSELFDALTPAWKSQPQFRWLVEQGKKGGKRMDPENSNFFTVPSEKVSNDLRDACAVCLILELRERTKGITVWFFANYPTNVSCNVRTVVPRAVFGSFRNQKVWDTNNKRKTFPFISILPRVWVLELVITTFGFPRFSISNLAAEIRDCHASRVLTIVALTVFWTIFGTSHAHTQHIKTWQKNQRNDAFNAFLKSFTKKKHK
jgi:hypothetical protein